MFEWLEFEPTKTIITFDIFSKDIVTCFVLFDNQRAATVMCKSNYAQVQVSVFASAEIALVVVGKMCVGALKLEEVPNLDEVTKEVEGSYTPETRLAEQ